MGIRGNGLRYCVRLGKIRKIESQFSKIEVRMAQLWPNEVCRKIKAKNRFENSNSDFKIEPAGPGGKIPALTMSTGLSTGLSTGGVDLPVDLPVDRVAASSEPGCTRLHQVGFQAG